MGKNNKRKREPTPPSEEFGDSEYSEEEFSSESEGSPAPIPLRESSADSDDSQGLAAEVWTYIRAVERSGLEGSDESEYSSDEEDSDGGEDEDDDDDDSDDDDGGDGDGDGSGSGGGRNRATGARPSAILDGTPAALGPAAKEKRPWRKTTRTRRKAARRRKSPSIAARKGRRAGVRAAAERD